MHSLLFPFIDHTHTHTHTHTFSLSLSLQVRRTHTHTHTHTHQLPLVGDVLWREVGVGVDATELDAVGLGDLQHLALDAHGSHALLIRLRQSGLELVMGRDYALWRTQGEDRK